MASPICLRLFEHFKRLAASRTFCTAGSNSPMRIAMIAITTKSSIRVNAFRVVCISPDVVRVFIGHSIEADRLSPVPRPGSAPGGLGDRTADGPDRPVHEQDIHDASSVIAAGDHRSV